jgi:ribosomal protein S1
VTGRVTNIESFGAFIEVEEGIEGLLPIGEISHRRIRTPAEVVKEGDTVRLVVLSVDPVARRMSFSLKQAAPAEPPPDETTPANAPTKPKKKRPELRGGLDF